MLPVIVIILGGAAAYQYAARQRDVSDAYRAGSADTVATVDAMHRGAQMAQRDAVILDPRLAIAAVTDQTPAIRRVTARAMRELERRAQLVSDVPLGSRISGMGAALPADVVAQRISEETPSVTWLEVRKLLKAQGVPPESIQRVKQRFARAGVDERAALLEALQTATTNYQGTPEDRAARQNQSVERLYSWVLQRLTVLEDRAAKMGARGLRVQSRLATYREQAAAARSRQDRETLVRIAAKLKGASTDENKPKRKRRKRRSVVRGAGRAAAGAGRAVGNVLKKVTPRPLKRLVKRVGRKRRRGPRKRATIDLRGMMGLVLGPASPVPMV